MSLVAMLRTLTLVSCLSYCAALTPLSAVGDDNDCALYLSGPGRTSAYDYTLNLLKGNFGYEGQHTCITYDAVNRAYIEARNRIVVAQPKGDWKPEDYASVGELVLDVSINLARTYGLTYEEIEKGLPLIDTSRTLIREVCPPVFSHVECRAGKYRRLDGLCNNLQHPTWGATNAPFQRLLGPVFADGMNSPRVSHTGRDLPLSRVVSRTMHPDEGFHDHAGTVMVIAWGQFMDHDYTLTGTPLDPRSRNDPEECCKRPPHLKHPYCNEIRVPDDDYFYRLWGVKCIDFVRAFPSPRPGCKLGSRIPFNTLTGVIDGNTVYGVTDKFARKLRMGHGGLLRMNPVFRDYGLKDILPLKLDIPDEGCTRPDKSMYCFEAGEIRVNEQLVLTVMHTLMAREHNRVAHALAGVNPHWDDETLYQEARRINIAEIQHITYNEFLPILLGKDVMDKFGLVLNKEGYWDGYDPSVNPDVIASFASAAYRFGHSLLPTAVERWSKTHKFIASKRLSDLIRRPFDLYRAGVLDEYVMGLMNQVAQAMDDSITQEVTNHLFKKVGARFGMDLVSFNMQRGREFGIPGYMEFRKFCGLPGADTFEELFGSMPNETVYKYKSIFEHPIDVDLWSGGVSERPLPGSMLGPTFACIIATQFSYSRRGDRFWFELPNQPSSFTPEQLAEIRKSRLARVICDNTDIIDTAQLYPFVLPDHELNPRVPCRSGIIPSMDFSKWAEPVPFHQGAKHFNTEAIYEERSETDCETPIHSINTKDTNYTNTDCGCNDTATSDKIQSDNNNTEDKVANDNENKAPIDALDETLACIELQESSKMENANNQTSDKNIVQRVTNDATNASKRNKRSLNEIHQDLYQNFTEKQTNASKRNKRSRPVYTKLKYAENFPLIRYNVVDKPKYLFDKQATNIVNTAHLADYNIQTLHPPNEKPFTGTKVFRNPLKNQEVNDSGDYLAKTISKPPEIIEKSVENVKSYENLSNKYEEIELNDNDDQKNKIYKSKKGGNIDYNGSRESNSGEEITDSAESKEKEIYRKEESTESKEKKEENTESKEKDSYRKKETSSESEDLNRNSGELRNKKTEKFPHLKNGYVLKKILKRPLNGGNVNQIEEYPGTKSPYLEYLNSNEKIRSEENTKEEISKEKILKEERSREESSKEADIPISEISREEVGDDVPEHRSLEEDKRSDEKIKQVHYRNKERKDETSREVGDDVPEHRSQEENRSSGEKIKPVHYTFSSIERRDEKPAQYTFRSKERKNKSDSGKTGESDYSQRPYRGNKEHYIDDSPRYMTPKNQDTEQRERKVDYNPLNSWYPNKQDFRQHPDVELISQKKAEDDNEEAVIFVMKKNRKADPKSKKTIGAKRQNYKQYHDNNVRPVIEIEREKEKNKGSNRNSNPEDEGNASLETVLGITNPDQSSESVQSKDDNQDAKQQFERIPVSYNHNNNRPQQKSEEKEPEETTTEFDLDKTLSNLGLIDPTTERYDENLNIKFKEDPIVLPQIKLPEDILSYARETDPDDRDRGKPKIQLDIDSDENQDEDSSREEDRGDNDESREVTHSNTSNEENSNRKDGSSEQDSVEDDDSHNHQYLGHDRKPEKSNDIKQGNSEENNHDKSFEEEEDLYEKFVRERFGKTGSFRKRSEKLLDSRPREFNEKLHKVIKKTENIDKEAAKSGDPNAGYLWTLEYGRNL